MSKPALEWETNPTPTALPPRAGGHGSVMDPEVIKLLQLMAKTPNKWIRVATGPINSISSTRTRLQSALRKHGFEWATRGNDMPTGQSALYARFFAGHIHDEQATVRLFDRIEADKAALRALQ